jgi:hypothetical protein
VQPLEGWISGDEILIEWNSSLDVGSAGVEYHEVRWTGGTWKRVNQNNTTQSIEGMADGRYIFEVRAIDAAGNIGDVTRVMVRIDRTAPAVLLTQLKSNSTAAVILVEVDDGTGSGSVSILYRFGEQTWQPLAADGSIPMSDWNETDLSILVTDAVNLSTQETLRLLVPDPSAVTEDPDERQRKATAVSGSITLGVAAFGVGGWVVALLVFLLSALVLHRRHQATQEFAEFDDEDNVEGVETAAVAFDQESVQAFLSDSGSELSEMASELVQASLSESDSTLTSTTLDSARSILSDSGSELSAEDLPDSSLQIESSPHTDEYQ